MKDEELKTLGFLIGHAIMALLLWLMLLLVCAALELNVVSYWTCAILTEPLAAYWMLKNSAEEPYNGASIGVDMAARRKDDCE